MLKHLFQITVFLTVGYAHALLDLDLPNPRRPHAVEGCEFLLTNMRAGTNLTICSLQILTNKPVRFFTPSLIEKDDLLGVNRLNIEVDYTKKILFRTHDSDIEKVPNDKNQLLMVLRNPKEVLLGFMYDDPDTFTEFLDSESAFLGYLDRIRTYDNWPEENKLLIYYEDLILEPENVLPEILDFFNESHDKLAMHLNNVEEDRLKISMSYQKQHKIGGGPLSRTQDIFFHSKKIPKELLQKADELLKKINPELWEKYLYRYETVEES